MRQTKEIATVFESQNYSINNIICDTMRKFKFKTLWSIPSAAREVHTRAFR